MMYLICRTSGDDSGVLSHAILPLDAAAARKRLGLRDLFAKAKALHDEAGGCHVGALFCLEFFDADVEYAEEVNGYEYGDGTPWRVLAPDAAPELDRECASTAETVKVTARGLIWSAAPKHGGAFVETPTLTWGDLEALARGECPLRRVGEAEEDGP